MYKLRKNNILRLLAIIVGLVIIILSCFWMSSATSPTPVYLAFGLLSLYLLALFLMTFGMVGEKVMKNFFSDIFKFFFEEE